MTDHLAFIDAYLDKVDPETIVVERVALIDWDASADRMHAPFGFTVPTLDDAGVFTVRFCPELISLQVAHLERERDVDMYLSVIEQHFCLHLIHDRSYPAEEAEALIERTLYDSGPISMAAHNEIQARALGVSRAS